MVGLALDDEDSESWASIRRTHPQFDEHCCPQALPVLSTLDVVDANILLVLERFAVMDDKDGFNRNLMIL